MPNELTTLNAAERSKLRLCETTIQKHLGTFMEVGNALAEIRDAKLYREEHKTFEAYCKAKWDFEKRHAYRLIAAAEVAEKVSHGTQKPESERTIRPLTQLEPEKQAEAWEAAVEKAKEAGQAVTAAIVEEVVEEMLGPDESESRDFGTCPNCAGTKWDEDSDGVSCSKCHHPHGEPAGDVDEDRIKIQRSKTVKTAEALMRAFDDLHTMLPRENHDQAISGCKALLKIAKGWK